MQMDVSLNLFHRTNLQWLFPYTCNLLMYFLFEFVILSLEVKETQCRWEWLHSFLSKLKLGNLNRNIRARLSTLMDSSVGEKQSLSGQYPRSLHAGQSSWWGDDCRTRRASWWNYCNYLTQKLRTRVTEELHTTV